MTNTTKVWLLGHLLFGYCVIAVLIIILSAFVNERHFETMTNLGDETSTAIFYLWIVVAPLLFAQSTDKVGGLIITTLAMLGTKTITAICYFTDSTIAFLPYVAAFIDLAATTWAIVLGIRIGKWTYANMDEVIPRRMRWRNSKVDIYSLSLKYSISQGIACAYCISNCVSLFLLAIVIR